MAIDKNITYDDPVVQGGVDNYLGKQPQVQAPRKWQSAPDKPATELAYITEAEKDLILKANIHGGLEGGPNMGPSGIMSLDSFGDVGGAGASGGDTSAGGGAMEGRGFSGRNTNTTSEREFDRQKANQRAALQIAERAQAKNLGYDERENIATRTYGPLQKYTGERGFLGNLLRGANRYGYTDTYTSGPKAGQVKPGYFGRVLGGIGSLLTGIPIVGSALGTAYDYGKGIFGRKPKDMSEFNRLGLGGVKPGTYDFDPDAKINTGLTEAELNAYSRFPTGTPKAFNRQFDINELASLIDAAKTPQGINFNPNDLSTAFTTNMGQSRMTPEMEQLYTEQMMKQNPSLYDELNPVEIAPSYELRNDGSFRPYEYNYNPEEGIMGIELTENESP